MQTQCNETRPQAQGDGDPTVWDLGYLTSTEANGVARRLMHLEKSGPAFSQQLEDSVASRTAKTIGELLNALGLPRECFLDVMPAWSRLLKILNITIHRTDYGGVLRLYPRQSWEFAEMREVVVLALCHQEERDALHHWTTADATLRGYAMTLAHGSESHLAKPQTLADEDVARIRGNAVAYRSFAEGRL